MKRKNIFYAVLAVLFLIMTACSNESDSSEDQKVSQLYTYRLHLDAAVSGFGQGITRSAYTWDDGSQIYLQFHVGSGLIHGTAKYSQSTGLWTITTNQQIAVDTDGDCEAFYFVNASGTSSQAVTLNSQSIIYQDIEGSFIFTEDKVMSVKILLSPRTGRVRFKGNASSKFGVSGLSYHTGYNFATNTFTTNNAKLSSSFDKEGDTGYYYVCFSDAAKRQLTVDGIGKGVYVRNFGEDVLLAGQSGYISLPSVDNLLVGWTLINTDNNQEITLPTVSVTEISKLRSRFATATANVSNLGNGTLNEVGFIYSTNSDLILANSTKVVCGKSSTIEARLVSLTAKTTYYIKAYAINERGTTYGSVANFTTISEEEDGTGFEREDFAEDEDLNNNSSSKGTINKEGYDEDEDLNNNSSSKGTINKEGYDNDEDLNNSSSSNGTINKGGFENDENWN